MEFMMPECQPSPPKRFRRRLLFALAAILGALFAGLLLLEIGLRVFLVRRGEYIDYLRENVSREWGSDLRMFDIIRPSENPSRVYELFPGANGVFAGQPIRISESGFRDLERPLEKPVGTTRIAVLGDSIAFGWGVAEEKRYTSVLQNLLNQQTSKTEVLNFAVPGYNTVMELATFRENAVPRSPDIVLLSMVNNDSELPNFVCIKPQAWSLQRCFIVETIRDRMIGRKLGDTARLARGGVAEAGGIGHGANASGYRPDQVPPEYRFLIGNNNMLRALQDIVTEANQRRIRPICVIHRTIVKETAQARPIVPQDNLGELAAEAGFEICDPTPALLSWLEENNAPAHALWVSPEDFHPNALAHDIIAQEIAKTIRR